MDVLSDSLLPAGLSIREWGAVLGHDARFLDAAAETLLRADPERLFWLATPDNRSVCIRLRDFLALLEQCGAGQPDFAQWRPARARRRGQILDVDGGQLAAPGRL
jgi:hypothetical protein